jgi:hypothetical protein
MKYTKAQCSADAARETEAGDPDQSVGPPAPELTAEQVCNIGFAVLRAYDDDKLWRALTYETGPYDLTMANRPLQQLGAAFYAAGYAAAPKTTMKVEISAGPELLMRAMAAETEAALLRAALDQKHAEYLDLKQCGENNARNLLRQAENMREPLRRLWPLIERGIKDYVFTGDKAGEVAADMAALRAIMKTPAP